MYIMDTESRAYLDDVVSLNRCPGLHTNEARCTGALRTERYRCLRRQFSPTAVEKSCAAHAQRHAFRLLPLQPPFSRLPTCR